MMIDMHAKRSRTAARAGMVMEHLPFERFGRALAEIHRVTRRHAVITLPDVTRRYSLTCNLPLLRHRSIALDLHNHPAYTHPRCKEEHYWEIGIPGYPLSHIENAMTKSSFSLTNSQRLPHNTYHHIFTLAKAIH